MDWMPAGGTMLKTLALPCALGLMTTGSTALGAQAGEDGGTNPINFSSVLVGTWKSAPDEMKLTSDFDKSVWGVNASSVRTLELTVRPSGEGTLRVTKKVVDGKGRVMPASTWIEEAQLKLGG